MKKNAFLPLKKQLTPNLAIKTLFNKNIKQSLVSYTTNNFSFRYHCKIEQKFYASMRQYCKTIENILFVISYTIKRLSQM